ncbi:unnamed protein product [Staurois parvus]|uniref:Uncharacterized protein n=1 Tax=Staurois parvus TaxID=386267 RepID=A0ABN9B5V6_9NEOB|nr:unnamed protein product [Staurois parvus]
MDNKPKGRSSLKEIRLVDSNVDTVRIFASTLKKEFGEKEAEPPPTYRVRRMEERPEPRERVYESRVSANQLVTKENFIIKVREGLIQEASVSTQNFVSKSLLNVWMK